MRENRKIEEALKPDFDDYEAENAAVPAKIKSDLN
jgi:hypothetical protein